LGNNQPLFDQREGDVNCVPDGKESTEAVGRETIDLKVGGGHDSAVRPESRKRPRDKSGSTTAGEGMDIFSRKALLGRAAVVAGGIALAGPAGAQASRLLAAEAQPPTALTVGEMSTLTAVLHRLFPKDELGVGAVQAGVPRYIDSSLANAYAADLPVYKSLLALFDTAAKSIGAKSFSDLSAGKQISLLKDVEAGKAAGVPPAQAKSAAGEFQLLLEHMREGLFADPMYGGNAGESGWKLIGFPGVKLVWTGEEQSVGAKVVPTNVTASTLGGRPYHGRAA
jgi:gluconate 2-dehydrogenase gamma chain